jgi:hypothetical protein
MRLTLVTRLGSFLLAGLLLTGATPAHAVGLTPQDGQVDNGIDVYMSAPNVQGSFVSGGVIENFNLGCGSSWAMGTMEGPCEGVDADDYGGASIETGTPTLGGVGTPYGRVVSGDTIEVTLTNPARYLGFWWTGGDGGNTFRFFSEGDLIAEYTTATVLEALGDDSVMATNGTSYLSEDYMTNPVNDEDTGEPYVYLHVVAKGDFTFDSFTFTHNRDEGFFEFDNVVTSVNSVTPTKNLVYVSSYGDRIADETGGGGGDSSSNTLAATGFDTAPVGYAAIVVTLVGATLVALRRRRFSR